MKRQAIPAVFVALWILCFCTGCSSKQANGDLVAGTYKWQHEDGRVEIWVIYRNLQFDQQFYQTVSDYKENHPFFTYQNVWTFKPGTVRPVLSFQRSYTLLDFGTDRPLNSPQEITGETAGWEEGKNGDAPYLDFFEDKGYIAVRIDQAKAGRAP